MSKYNKEWLEILAKETRLQDSADHEFEPVILGITEIDISGKVCKVSVCRGTNGNISIEPIDDHVRDEGGWVYQGTCTEGYNDDVIITSWRE